MDESFKIRELEKGLLDILSDIPSNSFSNLTLAINSSIKKLKEPMQLAIIGKISSSKSTLVNAILGKEEIMATGRVFKNRIKIWYKKWCYIGVSKLLTFNTLTYKIALCKFA